MPAASNNADTDSEYKQYYVYVLEAHLVFANGLTLPLMSEFLNYAEGDTSNDKQDCETRAFHRLASKLKEAFPRLAIMLLLDGLYPNGPVLEVCRKNRWQFMIVLQDASLPSVWEEYEGLRKIEPDKHARSHWGNRFQHFHWVNDIEYRYGTNQRKEQTVHVVVCEESWEEVDAEGNLVPKTRDVRRSKHLNYMTQPAVIISASGIAENGWVPINVRTLETRFPGVYAIGDGAATGLPKAGSFAESAARAVASSILAQLKGGEATPNSGTGSCLVEFGDGRLGWADLDFLTGPKLTSIYPAPSVAGRAHKVRFGATRRARWFGL